MSRSPRGWAAMAGLAVFAALHPFTAAPSEDPSLTERLGLTAVVRAGAESTLAEQAYEAIRDRRWVRARELADAALRQDPESPVGHGVLGVVLHKAEGSLPRALYHLNRSLELFEDRYGPASTSPLRGTHIWILREAAHLTGAMGRNEDKLELLQELEDHSLGLLLPAERGWPLMRLRRYDEAREAVAEALILDRRQHFQQHVTALNAICAIEGEQQNRMATYLACLESAELDRRDDLRDPVAYTNAAIGALAVLRMDEAERLILEGTEHFASGTVSNPWLDLMILYIGQGRVPEALDAMRRMFDWRRRQPPYMDEQNRAQIEVASALLLLVAGHPFEAARITRRALERPDRTGYTSSDSEQMESAAALVHGVACRTAAELRSEEASVAAWPESLGLRFEAFKLRLHAWSAARRAASLLAEDRILVSTIRPYLPGGVEIAEWIQLELSRVLGPGVVSAAVTEARERESLDLAEGYFLAFDTEIAWRQGRAEDALELAGRALESLPGPERLVRARVAALGAEAARSLGQTERAHDYYNRTLQADPGVIRRMGLDLPVRIRTDSSSIASRVADLLTDSPRFRVGRGFTIEAGSEGQQGRACLLGLQSEVLGCAEATPRAGESEQDLARRLARELHVAVFAPRVDLTQADIQSLDGSPTAAGGRSKERMRRILEGLGGTEPR